MSITEAIKKWREKRPSLVKKTVLEWIDRGLVSAVMETHGFTKWYTFTAKEVDRVYRLITPSSELGGTVLPRKRKLRR